MNRGIRGRIEGWWRGEGGVGRWLFAAVATPLEWLFRAGTWTRALAFDRGWSRRIRTRLPVVSIGNLAVGGTGKTPFTRWVVEELMRSGARPAVVLRGYGEDEVLLHQRWYPEVPVVAGPDREQGIAEAAERGARVAILDDGFQHRRVARDLDLVLMAAEHGAPRHLLPRGRFREGWGALSRADVVVVTERGGVPDPGTGPSGTRASAFSEDPASGGDGTALATEAGRQAPEVPVVRARFAPDGWTTLGGTPASRPKGPLVTVCSVAGPQGFIALVAESTGLHPVETFAFPDHHIYRERDLLRIESARARSGATLVTTEKDAVKLEPFAHLLGPARVLSLRTLILEGEAELRELLRSAAVGKRTR